MKRQHLKIKGIGLVFSTLLSPALSLACPAGDRAEILLNRSFNGKTRITLSDVIDLQGCEGRTLSGVAIVGRSQEGRGQARLYVNGQGVGLAQSVPAQLGANYFLPPPDAARVDLRSLQLYLDGTTGIVYVGGITVFFDDTFERRGR